MEKIISTGLAIFLTCNAVLAQPAGKIDYKTCNPDIRPAELAIISAAPKKQKLLLENDHLRLPEVLREPGEKEPFGHHKWSVLYKQKPGIFIDYEEKANPICDTRTLENSLQFPIKRYKGLKLNMH